MVYKSIDVIADFGGMVGLLLGASILSAFDLFSSMVKSIIEKFEAKFTRNVLNV